MYKSEWRGAGNKDKQGIKDRTKTALNTFNDILERHKKDFVISMLVAPAADRVFLGMPPEYWISAGLGTFAGAVIYREKIKKS